MPRPKRTSKPWLRGLKPNHEKVARNFVMWSRCVGYLNFPGVDQIYAVLVMPDHWKLIDPCQVYCYQTENPNARKFGIAKDHELRATPKIAIKDIHRKKRHNRIYNKFLWYQQCETRAEAICIEYMLYKELVSKTGEANEGWTAVNIVEDIHGTEVTDLPSEHLKARVLELHQDYKDLGSEGFIKKNLPKEYSLFHEDVRKILSGEYKFTCEVRDPKIPIPDDWSDKDKNWKGNIHYKNQKEPREEMIIKEIPINDMPEWFYEVYNFSLIPDSFWS